MMRFNVKLVLIIIITVEHAIQNTLFMMTSMYARNFTIAIGCERRRSLNMYNVPSLEMDSF